ncbi:Ig-like domain-containing protein [Cystobacter fuscus]
MKSSKALPWLPSLLVLAGCPGEPEPQPPPPPQLGEISVTCTPTTLVAGQSTQCSASATDQDGQPFPVSSYTWTSGDEAIAKVDGSGKVTTIAVASGTVAIRASAASGDVKRQGEASLAVTPKPATEHPEDVLTAETGVPPTIPIWCSTISRL